ncbi:ATP-binding protein [Candidatus Woesearchaeota archaeon]|nr:ATP-binding protein [Candidatus Woesearchaeota archaeon]
MFRVLRSLNPDILFDSSFSLPSFTQGSQKHLVLLGPQQSGKTRTLQTSMQRITGKKEVVFVDLSQISTSPEGFAIAFMGHVLFWLQSKKWEEFPDYLNLEKLLQSSCSPAAMQKLQLVANELQKIKPNQLLLVQEAFSFLSAATPNELVLYLDNIHYLDELNNFPKIGNVLAILHDALQKQPTVTCVAATHQETQYARLLQKYGFTIESWHPVSHEILDKWLVHQHQILSSQERALLLQITNGHPALIRAIVTRYQHAHEKNLKKVILEELLDEQSIVHQWCSNVYQESLARARGQSLLRVILHVLAYHEALRLSDVARKIYRSAPVTKSLLERLMEVDLVAKQQNTFTIPSLLLRHWIRLQQQGLVADHEVIAALTKKGEGL